MIVIIIDRYRGDEIKSASAKQSLSYIHVYIEQTLPSTTEPLLSNVNNVFTRSSINRAELLRIVGSRNDDDSQPFILTAQFHRSVSFAVHFAFFYII